MAEQEHPKPPQPPQHQERRPGLEADMTPRPQSDDPHYKGSGKLNGKVAVITGGDSGIGRAVATVFAKEGADISVIYLNEHDDARETQRLVEECGQQCLLVAGDVGDAAFCKKAVEETVDKWGRVDCLVNNAAEQHPQKDILDITPEQLEKTFRTNIFGMFYMTQAVLPHLKESSSIINTASVTAYKGNPKLLDYSATKGAIVSFTRSLSLALSESRIRVNAVAPGPIWTPLIPSTFSEEHVEKFGEDVPMKRPGQPEEVAKCFVFLASTDASYLSGQVIHPNGGTIVNG